MNKRKNILIACIGNIFLGDDGFGCEAARELQKRDLPENVKLFDFGIRSYDLVFALLENYELTILVDAAPNGENPGTLYIIEPDLSEFEEAPQEILNAHTLNPLRVLRLAFKMGAKFNKLLLIGCEPETFGGEEGFIGLSQPVQKAIKKAADLVVSLVEKHNAN